MNIGAACAEEGITHQLFRMWLRADPTLMALYEENRQAKVDLMRSYARGIVMDALSGGMKLKDKEKVDISLRFLEKTDDAWKDKHEIEVKVENFALTNEELEARAKELLTNIKNATNG